MLYAGGYDTWLYAGGCDTCYIQEVVIHVKYAGCDTCYIQEVVIHVICRRL